MSGRQTQTGRQTDRQTDREIQVGYCVGMLTSHLPVPVDLFPSDLMFWYPDELTTLYIRLNKRTQQTRFRFRSSGIRSCGFRSSEIRSGVIRQSGPSPICCNGNNVKISIVMLYFAVESEH